MRAGVSRTWPVDPGDVAGGHELRVRGRTASASSANGTTRRSNPHRSRGRASGASRPGCSASLVRTSSPGPRSSARQDGVHAVGGGVGERELVRVAAEPARDPVAQASARARHDRSKKRLPPRPSSSCERSIRGRLDRAPRDRPVGARVQVGQPLEDRELGAQGGMLGADTRLRPTDDHRAIDERRLALQRLPRGATRRAGRGADRLRRARASRCSRRSSARARRRAAAPHPPPPRPRGGEPRLQGAAGGGDPGPPLEAEELPDVDRTIEPGETLEVGGLRIEPLHTPGHTAGMLSFVVDGGTSSPATRSSRAPWAACGRPGSTGFADLKRSIMDVLMKLPPETEVHPGHTDPTTIGDEWEHERLRARLARPRRGGRRALHRLGAGGDARAVGARLRRRPQGLGALGRRPGRHRARAAGSSAERDGHGAPRQCSRGPARTADRPRGAVPAGQHAMPEPLAEDRRARARARTAWMLARFVCPASGSASSREMLGRGPRPERGARRRRGGASGRLGRRAHRRHRAWRRGAEGPVEALELRLPDPRPAAGFAPERPRGAAIEPTSSWSRRRLARHRAGRDRCDRGGRRAGSSCAAAGSAESSRRSSRWRW